MLQIWKNKPFVSLLVSYGWVILYLLGALYYAHCQIVITHDDMLHYFGISAYMNASHQYLYTSNFAGSLYTEKPPLFFWTIALGWKLFGISYWWPHLLSAFFIMSWIVLGKKIYQMFFPNDITGPALFPWVFAASVGGMTYLSYYRVDWILTFAFLLFYYGFVGLYLDEVKYHQKKYYFYIIFATVIGLLSKGPLIFIWTLVPCSIALLNKASNKQAIWTTLLYSFYGILLALVIWFIPAFLYSPTRYWHTMIGGVVKSHVQHFVGWHFILLKKVFLFYLLPWVAIVIVVSRSFRAAKDFYRRAPFWSFILVPTVIFFVHGGYDWYLLPAMPLCFMFLARVLSEGLGCAWIKRLCMIVLMVLFFCFSAILFYKLFFTVKDSHFLFYGSLPVGVFSVIAILCFLAGVLVLVKREQLFVFLPFYACVFFISYIAIQGYGKKKIISYSGRHKMLSLIAKQLEKKQAVAFYSGADSIVSGISLFELGLHHNLPVISSINLQSFMKQHAGALLITFNRDKKPCPKGFNYLIDLPYYKPYGQGQITLCQAKSHDLKK